MAARLAESAEDVHELNGPRNHAKRARKMELIYKEECYRLMGACFEVYRDKGCGFHEPVYDDCLEIELGLQGIPFVAKTRLELEIKAVSTIADEHRSQILNYLASTGFELGLLGNFGHHPRLGWERIANTKKSPPRL